MMLSAEYGATLGSVYGGLSVTAAGRMAFDPQSRNFAKAGRFANIKIKERLFTSRSCRLSGALPTGIFFKVYRSGRPPGVTDSSRSRLACRVPNFPRSRLPANFSELRSKGRPPGRVRAAVTPRESPTRGKVPHGC